MPSGTHHPGPSGDVQPASVLAKAAGEAEAWRQRIAKIHEAQQRLLSALQNNQLPLSQVAASLARLEAEMAEAQRGMKEATGAPA